MKKVKIFEKFVQENKRIKPEFNTSLDDKINEWAKINKYEILSVSCALTQKTSYLYQFVIVIYEDNL